MATDYQTSELITAADLFGGRLEKHGVREIIVEPKTERSRCLTDGTNYTWVKITERGFVDLITRYGSNDPQTILKAIAQEFDTDIYSEHDAEFWEGCDCGFGQWFS
jgi:hypothetical protein